MDDEKNVTRYQGKNVRVHYRVKDKETEKEMDAEGPAEEVEKYTGAFLSLIASDHHPVQRVMPFPVEDDTPLLSKSNGVLPETNGDNSDHQSSDLITFYREKSPKGQIQEVAVITYFYRIFKGYEDLTLNDYGEAYAILKKAEFVRKPASIKAAVRNTVDRTKYVESDREHRGKYSLTREGKEFVKNSTAMSNK